MLEEREPDRGRPWPHGPEDPYSSSADYDRYSSYSSVVHPASSSFPASSTSSDSSYSVPLNSNTTMSRIPGQHHHTLDTSAWRTSSRTSQIPTSSPAPQTMHTDISHSDKSRGLGTAGVAAAVVVPLLALTAVGLIAFLLLRRRKRKQRLPPSPSSSSLSAPPPPPAATAVRSSIRKHRSTRSSTSRVSFRRPCPPPPQLQQLPAMAQSNTQNPTYFSGLDTWSQSGGESTRTVSGEYHRISAGGTTEFDPPPPYGPDAAAAGSRVLLDEQGMVVGGTGTGAAGQGEGVRDVARNPFADPDHEDDGEAISDGMANGFAPARRSGTGRSRNSQRSAEWRNQRPASYLDARSESDVSRAGDEDDDRNPFMDQHDGGGDVSLVGSRADLGGQRWR